MMQSYQLSLRRGGDKVKILSLRRNLFLFLQLLLRMIKIPIYKAIYKSSQSKMKNLLLFIKTNFNDLKNKCHWEDTLEKGKAQFQMIMSSISKNMSFLWDWKVIQLISVKLNKVSILISGLKPWRMRWNPWKIMMFGILSSCPKVWNPLVASGYLRPRGIQKAISRYIKHDSLPKFHLEGRHWLQIDFLSSFNERFFQNHHGTCSSFWFRATSDGRKDCASHWWHWGNDIYIYGAVRKLC